MAPKVVVLPPKNPFLKIDPFPGFVPKPETIKKVAEQIKMLRQPKKDRQ